MDDDRLARAAKTRREFLGLSQAELAARSGVSESTIRSIEASRRSGFRPGTLRPIAEALGWTSDSFQRILRGEEPIEAQATERPRPEFDYLRELRELRREIEELKERFDTRERGQSS